MSDPEPTTELLRSLAAVLRGRRWYVFGAQAVVVWGRPRLSADVDATVEMNPDAVAAFLPTMKAAGFTLRITRDVEEFVARTRVLPFLHEPTRLPLDLVLAGPGLEQAFLERAVPVDRFGFTIPVISPEDLVVTKILAGRPKDLEDVQGVLAERAGALDLERVRADLDSLQRALGQSDLLPALERLLPE